MQGTLTLVTANIHLGPVTIQDGTIDMQIDGNGFIVVGAITNAEVGIKLLDGFKSGIALGFYDGPLPQYMTANLLDVTLYNQLPGLEKGLKGFYVNVMKSLSKDDLGISLPGPSLDKIPVVGSFVPTIDISAGIDLRTSINLQKGLSVDIGALAFAKASILWKIDLGELGECKIGLDASAKGKVDLHYENKIFTGAIIFAVGGGIEYCVGSKRVDLEVKLEKNSGGFSPSVALK